MSILLCVYVSACVRNCVGVILSLSLSDLPLSITSSLFRARVLSLSLSPPAPPPRLSFSRFLYACAQRRSGKLEEDQVCFQEAITTRVACRMPAAVAGMLCRGRHSDKNNVNSI